MRRILAPRFWCLVILLAVAGIGLPDQASADDAGNINFFLGFKMLDENDWEPVEDQTEVGVEVSVGPAAWPVDIALDGFISFGDESQGGVDLDVTMIELAAGVRKIWEVDSVRPYIGGGVTAIRAEADIEISGVGSTSDDDTGIGVWVGGGVFWRVGEAFNIGVAGRYSTADVEFDGGGDVDAGGWHVGLLLGWGW